MRSVILDPLQAFSIAPLRLLRKISSEFVWLTASVERRLESLST